MTTKKLILASATFLSTVTVVSAFDVVSCLFIGVNQYCRQPNSWFGEISPRPTDPENAPASYTSCASTRWDGDNVVMCTNGASLVEFEADPDYQDEIRRLLRTASLTKSTDIGLGDVTSCVFRNRDQYCVNAAGQVGEIDPRPTDPSNAPTQYTSCFRSDGDIYCKDRNIIVQFEIEGDDDNWRNFQTTVAATASSSSAAVGGTATIPLSTSTITSTFSTATAKNNIPGPLTSCRFHGAIQYCVNAAGHEGHIEPRPSDPANAPTSYTNCRYEDENEHNHENYEDLICTENGTVITFEVDHHDNHRQSSRRHMMTTDTISGTTTASMRISNTPGSLTSCHFHGVTQYCYNKAGLEGSIRSRFTNTADAPASYETCRFEDQYDNQKDDEDLICTQDGIIVTFDVDKDDQLRITREHAEITSRVTPTTEVILSTTATSSVTSTIFSSAPAATTSEKVSNAATLIQVALSFVLGGIAILFLF